MSYKIKKAVISLSDKSEIKLILNILKKFKVNVISSGGTSKEIKKLGYKCTDVSEYTNSDEILDGRVKTLHPKLYAGILNKRDNVNHKKELKKNNYDEIDLVIVNFYPFEETLKSTKNHNKLIENIDIGGPTLVRAAAKNYKYTTVLTSPHQYKEFILDLEKNKGSTSLELRKKLSQEAFNLTAYYDSVISEYLNKINNDHYPQKKTIHGNLVEVLRYG
ncbi:bifunctional phosphoribosylaminoimidazolecarboxamide formyltransferase/IMP cyclohydrolase PurH, partial [Candidatus Pelagibacter sp.]|nr:bifunctional phosphoribosylaminoimidazolecarboxamide formyltransferase/IMP cyclohydrolase PurH [Candidatus Pelagibacter sp.]